MDPPSTSSVPLTRIHWQSNTTSAPRHLRCCSASAWYAHRAQPFHIRLRCHDSMIIKQESDIRSSRRRLSRLPEPRQRQVTWLGRWSLIITPCLKSRRTEVSLARQKADHPASLPRASTGVMILWSLIRGRATGQRGRVVWQWCTGQGRSSSYAAASSRVPQWCTGSVRSHV